MRPGERRDASSIAASFFPPSAFFPPLAALRLFVTVTIHFCLLTASRLFFFSEKSDSSTCRRKWKNGADDTVRRNTFWFRVVRSRNVELEARVSSRYWWKDCLKFDHCGKRDENVRSGSRFACASYEGRGTLKISKQRYRSGNVICR